MLSEKFYECLKHEGIVAIGSCSSECNAHIVNTWNSFVIVTADEKLLIPAAGMVKTEKNVQSNSYIEITLGSHEVMGYKSMGTGFLLTGTAEFVSEGDYFDSMHKKCSFANRVLIFTPNSCKQMQ